MNDAPLNGRCQYHGKRDVLRERALSGFDAMSDDGPRFAPPWASADVDCRARPTIVRRRASATACTSRRPGRHKRRSLALLVVSAVSISGISRAGPLIDTEISDKIRALLPEAQVRSIRASPIDGIREATLETGIVYVSDDGRYVFNADLLDLTDRRNLSEEQRAAARLRELDAVPLSSMIEFAPEVSTHVLYVYTDIDCGYCRKFHQQINELTKAGMTVRYLAYPRAGVDSESFRKSVSVWCAKDRQTALTDAKLGKPVPTVTCDNPVKEHFDLGKRMRVRGTPTIITDTGAMLPGYATTEQLAQFFEASPRSQ